MVIVIFNRCLSLSDTQLVPQRLDFAVTRLVTVLIFGIFCPRSPGEATIRLPGTAQLFKNRRSVAPRTFHATCDRDERGTKVLCKLQQLWQLVDNLVSGILAKAEALLTLGNHRQTGSLAGGDAGYRVLNAAAAVRGQPQQIQRM